MVLGVQQLAPPQPLGDVGRRPPELVAALLEHPGTGLFHPVGQVRRGRQGWQEAVLVQKDHAQLVVKAVAPVVLAPGHSQIYAVAIGKLHQVDSGVGQVFVIQLRFIRALHHQHFTKGGGDIPVFIGPHVGHQVDDVIVPERVQQPVGVCPGTV